MKNLKKELDRIQALLKEKDKKINDQQDEIVELRSENLGQKRKIEKLTQDNIRGKKALESAGSNIIGNPRDEESSEEQPVEEEQIQSITSRREREREMMF